MQDVFGRARSDDRYAGKRNAKSDRVAARSSAMLRLVAAFLPAPARCSRAPDRTNIFAFAFKFAAMLLRARILNVAGARSAFSAAGFIAPIRDARHAIGDRPASAAVLLPIFAARFKRA